MWDEFVERKAPDILLLVDLVQNVRWTLGVIDFSVESKRKKGRRCVRNPSAMLGA